ncbi:MAG: SpoIIE family protein phosphatase [Proteobacteria bacterium]|nr:SpoIIE family protein phosphatase [Pseudomonadota bacterium]
MLFRLYYFSLFECFSRLPDGAFFGEQHFKTLLSANADMSLVDLCDSVLATVKAYQANKLNDDVTLLVLRKLC